MNCPNYRPLARRLLSETRMKPAPHPTRPYDRGMDFARQAYIGGGNRGGGAAAPAGDVATEPSRGEESRAEVPLRGDESLRTQPERQCPGPGEPHEPAEAGTSRGVNISPGSD